MEPSSLTSDAAGPSSSAPEQGRKLFVGGISSDTGEDALAEYFARFGLVQEVEVMRDRVTGNARGFGFVQFAHLEAAESALQNTKHVILGRTVEVKRAIPKGAVHHNHQHHNPHLTRGSSRNLNGDTDSASSSNGSNTNIKKIFIGGLPVSVTQHELKIYFEKFGSVIDAVVMYDNITQRPRGFGFVTFSSEDSVVTVLQNNNVHKLNGKIIDVKRAVPKDESNCTYDRNNGNHHSPRANGGRGGRWPVYGHHQNQFYPRYGDHQHNNYYGAAATFPPYLYGGPYEAYNSGGLHGNGYAGQFSWNHSGGMVYPFVYPHYVNGGFGSNMFVPTVANAPDYGSNINNENQGGLMQTGSPPNVQADRAHNAQLTTIGTVTGSQIVIMDSRWPLDT